MSKTEATQIVISQNFFVFLAAERFAERFAAVRYQRDLEPQYSPNWMFHTHKMEKLIDEFQGHLRNAYPLNDAFHNAVLEHFDHCENTVYLSLRGDLL